MRELLIFVVKLARDAGMTDKQIVDVLKRAADQIEKGGFWPSDVHKIR